MAEIQQDNAGGKKGKNHQKKMTIRVDFTPMVDMNMLLITFFMLCTTMIKSQTLSISLPTNEKIDNEEQMNQASTEDAITIIVDAKRKPGTDIVDSINGKVVNEVYFYDGKPGVENGAITENNLQKSSLLTDEVNGDGTKTGGIRKIIQDRNKEVLAEIKKLKEKLNSGGFGPMETSAERDSAYAKYNREATDVRRNEKIHKPVIIIKSTAQASYGALVEILDEMQINSISKYQIDNLTREDSLLLIDFRQRK